MKHGRRKLVDIKPNRLGWATFEKGKEYIFIKSKAIKNSGRKYDYYDDLSGKTFIHDGRYESSGEIQIGGGVRLTVFPEECKEVVKVWKEK